MMRWFACGLLAAAWTTVTPTRGAELVAHWPLAADAQDASGSGWHGVVEGGVRFSADDAAQGSADFDGRDGQIVVNPPADAELGRDDFTLSAWVRLSDAGDDNPGDLLSWYDPQQRQGFHLSIKTAAGATFSQASTRQLQFGVDQRRDSAWEDCGRPGGDGSLLAFALAVHRGALYAGVCRPELGDAGRVYRYAGGQEWVDCGAPAACNAVTALISIDGALYAGTGKYRTAGSSLAESENPHLGGRVYRYEGEQRWTDCGGLPEAEAIGSLVAFRGRLYATSLYAPAGFYRYDGDQRWTDCGSPDGKRVESLAPYNGFLYAASYDLGHVYRYDGATWTDCGQVGENTQCYGFASYWGRLYVSTWPSGRVYRFADVDDWQDTGRLGEELEAMGLAVHNGRLLGGTLPLAEVHQYDGDGQWQKLARLDHTPDVKYRRAWTAAEHQGRIYWSTLPSGRVWSFAAGCSVSWDEPFPSEWHHVQAVRRGERLELWVDGKRIAQSAPFAPQDYVLHPATPLRIGAGANDFLHGRLRDVRLYRGAKPVDAP